jgi:hypothetical protein
MEPQLFVEFDTEAELLMWEQWCCRCYALDNNVAYPIPDDPPSTGLTYVYIEGARKPEGGGVAKLNDDSVRFAVTTEFTMTDASTYAFDIAASAKTFAQLSEAGKLLYPPYVEDPPPSDPPPSDPPPSDPPPSDPPPEE